MARKIAHSGSADMWMLAVFGLTVAAALVGAMTASLTQAQSVDVPAAFLGSAAVAAAVGLVLGGRASRLPLSRLGVSWTLFVGWAFLAAVFSGRSLAAFAGEPTNLIGWWALASMAAVGWFAASRTAQARGMLVAASPWLLLVQVMLAVFALVQSGGTPDLAYDLVVRGTLPNSTVLGEFALLLLPWTLLPATRKESARAPWWRLAIVGATLGVLAVSRSRVALAIAVLWVVWWALGRSRLATRTRFVAVSALIAAVLLGGGVYVVGELRNPTGGQLGLRPEFTRVALAAAASAPVFGFGPDGFVAGGAQVSTPEFVRRTATPLVFKRGATDPHNVLLWVVVSTGYVGLALFLWALVESALAIARSIRSGDSQTAVGAWAVGGTLVVLVTAPASVAILPLLAFVFGSALPEGAPVPQEVPTARRLTWAELGTVGLAGLLLTANALTRLPFEQADSERSPGLARQAQSAASVWALDPYLYYLASLHWGWSAHSDSAVAAARLDLAASSQVVALDRRDPFAALEHARALRYYRADRAEVDAAFDEALHRWPTYPAARLEYAHYLAETARPAAALDQLAVVDGLAAGDTDLHAAAQELRGALEQLAP